MGPACVAIPPWWHNFAALSSCASCCCCVKIALRTYRSFILSIFVSGRYVLYACLLQLILYACLLQLILLLLLLYIWCCCYWLYLFWQFPVRSFLGWRSSQSNRFWFVLSCNGIRRPALLPLLSNPNRGFATPGTHELAASSCPVVKTKISCS